MKVVYDHIGWVSKSADDESGTEQGLTTMPEVESGEAYNQWFGDWLFKI